MEPIPLLSPIADRCPVADMGALACEQDPNSAACTACYDDKTASCDAVACKAIATELLSCARAHDCLTPEGLVDWACGLEHCDTGPSSLSAYVECIAGCPKLTQCESSSADRCCGLNQRMDKVFVAKVCKWQICTNEFIRLGSDGTFSQTLVVSWGDIDVARPFADTDHLLSATSDRGVWSTDCDFLTVVRCGGAVRERRHYRYTGAVWRTALYSAGENSALPEQSFSEVDVAFPVAPAGWDEKCR